MAQRVVGSISRALRHASLSTRHQIGWQCRTAATVSVAERLGILSTTKADSTTDIGPDDEQDDEQFVSLVPDTCCGTVQMHSRQLVLLTPESHSIWPSRPEAAKGSLAWKYSQMLKAAIKRVRAETHAVAPTAKIAETQPPEGIKSSGGACGIGPRAVVDDGADEEDELEPGADRTDDTASGCTASDSSTGMNPLHVKFLMADMRGAGAVDPMFAFSDSKPAYLEQRRHAVMLFPDNVLVSDLSPSDVASVVSAAQAAPGQAESRLRELLVTLGSSARVERLAGLHFLVCAHTRRDKRCGENGITVIGWLRKWRSRRLSDVASAAFKWRNLRQQTVAALQRTDGEAPSLPLQPVPVPSPSGLPTPLSVAYGVPAREVIHVWPVSHVGLHRMAANVLVNPPGDWFAHMHDERDARALFDHAVDLGLATVPPDRDPAHPLHRAPRAELASLALHGVEWDARLPVLENSDPKPPAEQDMYASTHVARMIEPVAHWWRGRLGMTKQEQQRVFLEISPKANLDHANLSAKLMGGVDRH